VVGGERGDGSMMSWLVETRIGGLYDVEKNVSKEQRISFLWSTYPLPPGRPFSLGCLLLSVFLVVLSHMSNKPFYAQS
jgi:hypothetical protein